MGMKKRSAIPSTTTLFVVAFPAILVTSACGGKLEPGASGAGGPDATSTAGGSGGSSGQGTGGASVSGGSGGTTVGSGGSGTGGSTGGSGGSGATGGTGGSGGTCRAGCNVPAGPLRDFSSVDEVYAALAGLWQICPTTGVAFDAPRDAIGVEYVAPKPGGGGDMFYLVPGPTGPIRGTGFAYQRTYDVSFVAGRFQLNTQRPAVVASATLRYSPCPEQFEVNVSAMVGLIARFP